MWFAHVQRSKSVASVRVRDFPPNGCGNVPPVVIVVCEEATENFDTDEIKMKKAVLD